VPGFTEQQGHQIGDPDACYWGSSNSIRGLVNQIPPGSYQVARRFSLCFMGNCAMAVSFGLPYIALKF
jgi:hypothetical protein